MCGLLFSSRRRHTRCYRDWSSDVCSSDLDRKSTRLNSSHGNISYAVSLDRKSTRLNSSHGSISYAVFCLKKKHKCSNYLFEYVGSAATSVTPTASRRQRARAACYPSGEQLRDGVLRTYVVFFFFNDTATTEIYTLSLHDALPIFHRASVDPFRILPVHRDGLAELS